MPSQLAVLAGWCFVAWLMKQDQRARVGVSWSLLIPGFWLAMQGSRPLSFWLGVGDSGDDSNLLDTVLFAGLLVSAVIVLRRKGLAWGALARENRTLFLLYFYFVLSIVWSDLPVLSTKRIVKDFGCVLMGLVMLSQANPSEAIRTVYVRVSYVLFVFSVITIKYLPWIGRQARRSGDAMFRGVTPHKSALGHILFVFGLMLLWDLTEVWKKRDHPGRKRQIQIRVGMLLITAWLLVTCEAKTALVCILIGAFLFWAGGRLSKMNNGKAILIAGLAFTIGLVAADKTFGLSEMAIRALGKDPTLTGRTALWQLIKNTNTDPVLGTGFYVFWDTSRGKTVDEEFMMPIKSAHNGFLEVYLDGGIVGVSLLVLLLLAIGRKVIHRLFSGHPLGQMGLVFWVLSIFYNLSESSFFRLDPLWLTLLLISTEWPAGARQQVQAPAGDRRLYTVPNAAG